MDSYQYPNDSSKCENQRICDLSQSKLTILPSNVLEESSLKMLCLSDNQMTTLPPDLFRRLVNLVWLDVRNNALIDLCSDGLSEHLYLSTLLLGNNQITHLPVELGNLIPLKSLNLAGNPLIFPPEHIIKSNLRAIKSYLSRVAAGEDVNSFLSEKISTGSELSQDNVNAAMPSIHSKEATIGNRLSKKDKITSKDSTKLLPVKADKPKKLPGPLVNPSAAEGDHLPTIERIEKKAVEERRAKKEQLVKMQQDEMLQKVKDDDTRKKWRQDAKLLQMKKTMQRAGMPKYAVDKESESRIQRAPFDTNKNNMNVVSGPELIQLKNTTIEEDEKPVPLSLEERLAEEAFRLSEEVHLVDNVKRHAEAIRARKVELSREQGFTDTDAIRRELQIAEELQREIALRRKALEHNMTMYK